ncbi:hypothetical protein PT7_P001 (plasmid) [Pusillimonas sp. T7-7]|nr:hypothetical protein PT7_P001 [Pusillimonas sp. T7-7]
MKEPEVLTIGQTEQLFRRSVNVVWRLVFINSLRDLQIFISRHLRLFGGTSSQKGCQQKKINGTQVSPPLQSYM